MARNKFGGFGGGTNMQQLMRQAQKMQEEMTKAQENLEEKTYESSVGGGVVKCSVSGKQEVLSITISPEVVDPDDVDMLQDMIISAVNEALRMCQEDREKTMGAAIPGGLGGLF
ncbi:MAG: YbaB/EbfC family nucleoid-associated protein [Christensenellales bacterium]|jgi:DNA-binding YbaB/EbfC family protein|nr:YbaB/EbfC family nucleoid-associated protein [Christensenellaceae bacterium]